MNLVDETFCKIYYFFWVLEAVLLFDEPFVQRIPESYHAYLELARAIQGKYLVDAWSQSENKLPDAWYLITDSDECLNNFDHLIDLFELNIVNCCCEDISFSYLADARIDKQLSKPIIGELVSALLSSLL